MNDIWYQQHKSWESQGTPQCQPPPPGKEGLNKTFIGEWWSIIPYTIRKVDDATPMSWFIMAPYQLPPNLGLAYLRHLFALRCHKGGFPAFSAGQVSVESQSVDWTHWPPWARKLSLSFPKRFPKKLKRWKPQKILFLQISMTYDLWVTKKQNKELLMCLCVCMWIAWFFDACLGVLANKDSYFASKTWFCWLFAKSLCFEGPTDAPNEIALKKVG